MTGHSVYIEGQSIEERYLKTTGGKVTGELEVEGSLHIHGEGDVDTPKLIINDPDSDERYQLRTEYIPPTGSASSATIGDVKESAFLLSDHGGWVLLEWPSNIRPNGDSAGSVPDSGICGEFAECCECCVDAGGNYGSGVREQ